MDLLNEIRKLNSEVNVLLKASKFDEAIEKATKAIDLSKKLLEEYPDFFPGLPTHSGRRAQLAQLYLLRAGGYAARAQNIPGADVEADYKLSLQDLESGIDVIRDDTGASHLRKEMEKFHRGITDLLQRHRQKTEPLSTARSVESERSQRRWWEFWK